MICPNCGFNLPNGSMFCGNCGTRLQAAPVPPQAAPHPAAPAYPPVYRTVSAPVLQQSAASPRPAVAAQPTMPVMPAAPAENPIRSTLYNPAATGSLFPYSTAGMPVRQSISSAQTARLTYNRGEYTGVTPSAFSGVSQRSIELDSGSGNGATIILTICIILLSAALLYLSGVFDFGSRGTLEPEPPAVTEPSGQDMPIDINDKSGSDITSGSDISVKSDTDAPEQTEPAESDNEPDTAPSGTQGSMPISFGETERKELNSFLSAFAEVEFLSFSEEANLDEALRFAVSGLSLNSSVYSPLPQPYTSRGNTYSYSVPSTAVFDRVERYFGADISGAVKQFDSGNGWLFYQNDFYFPEIVTSKGFALATSYIESDGKADVLFNIYAPTENDASYYGLTATQAQDAGLSLIGKGDANVVKNEYNGREVYMISAYDVRYDQ